MKRMNGNSDISLINGFPDCFKVNHSSLQSRVLHQPSRSLYHPVNLLSQDWKDRGQMNGQTGSSWPQSLRPGLPASLQAKQAVQGLVLSAVHEDDVYPRFRISTDRLQRQKGFFFTNGGLMSSEHVLFCLPSSERSETKYTISTAICRQQAPGHRGRGRLWSGKEPTCRRHDPSLLSRP